MPSRGDQDPFSVVAATCLSRQARLVNRVVSRVYDDTLRPLGLKASQFNIMVATARMGTARPADLCASLRLRPSTLSRNVNVLHVNGWIEFLPEETDGRAKSLRLTAAGSTLMRRSMSAWERAQSEVEGLLGKDGVKALGLLADKLTQTVKEEDDE